ncbi:MAG TPA: peptide-methionine (S)-S-oxide reductase MsrA [Flavobacteriales bacterium]|jgi:peptide-methionine (S)-S-oxide reductase|nr:peptide-methionine (S)-S-oxide reductase MsrA [Flavobacteriales bacterium]
MDTHTNLRKWVMLAPLLAGMSPLAACSSPDTNTHTKETAHMTDRPTSALPATTDTVVLGAGCFWCVEAVFTELKGVVSVMPGYTGGQTPDPDYKAVCTGTTGHAEVAQVVYDPSVITFDELLEVFWQTHDPTTLNRQGHDVGTQYRSAIFYTSDAQRATAERYKAELDKSGAFDRPIVTEIAKLDHFYPAENYHRDYYANNPEQGYCQLVIRPKVEKFRKVFADKLKH